MPNILYIDDLPMMHEEWEDSLGTRLRRMGVSTLHCVGYASHTLDLDGLELLTAAQVIRVLDTTEIDLIVSDVYMPNPKKRNQFGGLSFVAELSENLGNRTPPVLFASTRPQPVEQEKLAQELDLNIIGDVRIDARYVGSTAHWDRIFTHISRHFNVERSRIIELEPTDPEDFVLFGDFRIYREVAVQYQDASIKMNAWSSRSIVFQLLARTPRRIWSTEEIVELLYDYRKQLIRASSLTGLSASGDLQSADSAWSVLLEMDTRPLVDQRLRNAFNALLKRFPGVFFKLDSGSHFFQGETNWLLEEPS